MWEKISGFILKNRLLIIAIVILMFVLFGIQATKIRMSYEFAKTLPETDSTMIVYQNFLKKYGQDGCVVFVGAQYEDLYTLENFNKWYDLTHELRNIDGVEECLSVSNLINIKKNDSVKKFDIVKLVEERPQTQDDVDAIKAEIDNLLLFEGLLFNSDTDVNMIMITVEKDVVNSKSRDKLAFNIKSIVEKYEQDNGVKMHISGLPYIRTITTDKMKVEIISFIVLSIIVTAIILFLFFKSLKLVMTIMMVVGVSMVFVFGTMGILGFEVTILTGVIPPLLVIICVENSIFILNKYHREFLSNNDKFKSLNIVIQRIGSANLFTNATTAASFASFIVTGNKMLVDFGLVASINIFLSYLLTLSLLPVILSYQNDPVEKQYRYLNNNKTSSIIEKVISIVADHRKTVYVIVAVIGVVSVFGALNLKTTGSVVDDISKKDVLYKDLTFFEEHFNGVMPYEITIDTRKPKGILNVNFINKVQQLEDSLAMYKEFSEPLSVTRVVKTAREAFYNGDKKYYSIPSRQEFNFMLPYLSDIKSDNTPGIVKSFIGDDMSSTRISVQMANVTTPKIDSINKSLKPKIASIFPEDKYDVVVTGSSVVFLEGTNYLVRNLLYSLLLAFVVIALLMMFSFRSFKMVLVSMVPNLIPQLLTAGLMGYCGIPLKTSSIIIFSIALGISVDNTIHYLSRYRQQRIMLGTENRTAIISSIRETGPSMISSACVLICGFLIFVFSSFGATLIVGYLVPFTLLIALLTNLIVLPCIMTSVYKNK